MVFWFNMIGLLRRPRVIVPTVLVATALGAAAFFATPLNYASSATMVLTTTQFGGTESRDPAQPTDLTNPMLNFNESLITTSAILIQRMNTKPVAKQLGATGSSTLVVDDGRTNPTLLGVNGPFISVIGTSTSPEKAQRMVVESQQLMRDDLRKRQIELKAPEKTYVSLVDVVSPSTPEADRGQSINNGLLAFFFGFVLSWGVAYLTLRRRGRAPVRASEMRTPGSSAEPLGDGADPDQVRDPSQDSLRSQVEEEPTSETETRLLNKIGIGNP